MRVPPTSSDGTQLQANPGQELAMQANELISGAYAESVGVPINAYEKVRQFLVFI